MLKGTQRVNKQIYQGLNFLKCFFIYYPQILLFSSFRNDYQFANERIYIYNKQQICLAMKAIKKGISQDKTSKNIIKPQLIDTQTQCPICLEDYDLLKKVPMMVCLNQHSSCAKCLNYIYQKRKCPVCCQKLIKRSDIRKNRLICNLLEEMFRGNGEVVLSSNTYTYKGETKNGKRHGNGEQLTKNGNLFKGQFVNGELTGSCQVLTKKGARFTGQAKNGRLQGTFTTKYGSVIEGSFDMQNLSGPNCHKKYTNGDEYAGMIKQLKANGHGKLIFANGNILQGQFQKDYISLNCSTVIKGQFNMQIQNGQLRIKQIEEQLNNDQSSSQQSQYSHSQPSREPSEVSYEQQHSNF